MQMLVSKYCSHDLMQICVCYTKFTECEKYYTKEGSDKII